MAKQTFTTGSVLTAAQMNSLQANDYNWTVNSQTASYVLVAADAGKRVEMNAAGATTITVNTSLFTAGDMVYISNIGAGVCTVTAGTATVNKSTNASLALSQYQGGVLYFVSASSSIFYPFDIGSAGGDKTIALITSGTLSGTTTTISNLSTYDTILLYMKASTSTGGSDYTWRLKPNGGTGLSFTTQELTFSSTAANFNQSTYDAGNHLLLGNGTYPVTKTDSNNGFTVLFTNCKSAGYTNVFATSGWYNSTTKYGYLANGMWKVSAAISSIEITTSAGTNTFTAGDYIVYGG